MNFHKEIAQNTHLTVTLQVESVVPLPCLASSSGSLVKAMTLAQTTRLLASGSKATRFTVLVDRLDDPVYARIATDGLVLRVNKNNLEVFVGRVLVDPVRVEDAQVSATTSDTLLSSGLERSLVLELIYTMVGGLAVSSTLWHWTLASTTANTNAVDDIALLGLVTKTASLVWT